MATIIFTQNLQRHLSCPDDKVPAGSLLAALQYYFDRHKGVRDYLLNDQGALRKHVAIYLDGEQIRDRQLFSDAVNPDTEIYVFQALSGG